jgi:aflatoxin B1 aldehyde reductase
LRTNHIPFYAYSESAGSFLSGKVTQAISGISSSRFDAKPPFGANYCNDYLHSPVFATCEMVRQNAQQHGVKGHAIGLRWILWHSQPDAECGDGVVVGASSLEQPEKNLDILEQVLLPRGLVHAIGMAWDVVKGIDNEPKYSMGA